jgi:hypothetical protein
MRLVGWLGAIFILCVSVLLALYVSYDLLPTPIRGLLFTAVFDLNLMSVPVQRDAVRDDPALHRLLLERTREAYLKGGWPAADDALRVVINQHVVVYADDTHILRLARAYHAAMVHFARNPAVCQRYGLTSYDKADFQTAEEETRIVEDAMQAAIADGARRRREGVKWSSPTHDTSKTALLATMQGPDKLSPDEVAAMWAGKYAAAPLWCAANLRADRNLLARPQAEAAWLFRIFLAGESTRENLPTLPKRELGDAPAVTGDVPLPKVR